MNLHNYQKNNKIQIRAYNNVTGNVIIAYRKVIKVNFLLIIMGNDEDE